MVIDVNSAVPKLRSVQRPPGPDKGNGGKYLILPR
jgi:hypothetical protein